MRRVPRCESPSPRCVLMLRLSKPSLMLMPCSCFCVPFSGPTQSSGSDDSEEEEPSSESVHDQLLRDYHHRNRDAQDVKLPGLSECRQGARRGQRRRNKRIKRRKRASEPTELDKMKIAWHGSKRAWKKNALRNAPSAADRRQHELSNQRAQSEPLVLPRIGAENQSGSADRWSGHHPDLTTLRPTRLHRTEQPQAVSSGPAAFTDGKPPARQRKARRKEQLPSVSRRMPAVRKAQMQRRAVSLGPHAQGPPRGMLGETASKSEVRAKIRRMQRAEGFLRFSRKPWPVL